MVCSVVLKLNRLSDFVSVVHRNPSYVTHWAYRLETDHTFVIFNVVHQLFQLHGKHSSHIAIQLSYGIDFFLLFVRLS